MDGPFLLIHLTHRIYNIHAVHEMAVSAKPTCVHVRTCVYLCMHEFMCACVYLDACAYVHVCICTYVCARAYVCMCVRLMCVCVCVCVCAYVSSLFLPCTFIVRTVTSASPFSTPSLTSPQPLGHHPASTSPHLPSSPIPPNPCQLNSFRHLLQWRMECLPSVTSGVCDVVCGVVCGCVWCGVCVVCGCVVCVHVCVVCYLLSITLQYAPCDILRTHFPNSY